MTEKAPYEEIRDCLDDIINNQSDFVNEMMDLMEGEAKEDIIHGFQLYFRFVKAALQGRSSEDIRYEILLDKAETIEQTILTDALERLEK